MIDISKVFVRTTPKRRIEKKVSQIYNLDFTVNQIDVVLHTVEDAKTLVRTIVDIHYANRASDGSTNRLVGAISRAPSGVIIPVLSIGQVLDRTPPTEELLFFPRIVNAALAVGGTSSVVEVQIDSKAMRKLKPGDTIVYSCRSDAANLIGSHGSITLFFKE